MGKFSDGFRSFKEGLDKKLILDYWIAVKNHAWETFWGAGAIGIIITTYTLYRPPSRWLLGWVVAWAFLVAGYFTWRAYHVRFIPKLAVRDWHFQETPITRDGMVYDHRTFVQLVPTCLTEAPVYDCVAYLQRVEKLSAANDWEETTLDRNLILNWANEHHPQSEQMLNVFFIQHQTNQIIPCLPPSADIPWAKFDSIFRGEPGLTDFRFFIQITYSDKVHGDSLKPVRVRLDVKFDGDQFHPSLKMTEMNA